MGPPKPINHSPGLGRNDRANYRHHDHLHCHSLLILVAGTWQGAEAEGVTLTANAFSSLLGPVGTVIIFACVLSFATTTIFTYSFYGSQCASFVFGTRHRASYQWVFVASIVLVSVMSIEATVGLIDGSFALMAIPTMVSAIWLAPKVLAEAKIYWKTLPPKTQLVRHANTRGRSRYALSTLPEALRAAKPASEHTQRPKPRCVSN